MPAHFDGPEYEPSLDYARLTKQHERVRDAMIDGVWRTLEEISALTGDPPASISAQLRHLRKTRFGSYIVEKRSRGVREKGLYEYRLLPPSQGAGMQQIELPLTKQVIHVHTNTGGPAQTHDVYEGEAKMSQQQQDAYKALQGDKEASVTVSRELSEADYGNGGKVFVSVTLRCDQSGPVINQAIALAHQVAEGAAFHYHGLMRSQLEQRGMLKPR